MKKILIGIVVVAAIGFAYYAISPLFRNVELDEALPENIIEEEPVVNNESVPSGFEELTEERQQEMVILMDEVNSEEPKEMNEEMPSVSPSEEGEAPSAPTQPSSASVMGTLGHPADGTARLLETTDGSIVRYENLSTINGPNLHVYLAKDLKANEFIDLGPIKGTRGNINYSIPDGIDIEEYPYVMHWCVPFGVLFNYAEIQ